MKLNSERKRFVSSSTEGPPTSIDNTLEINFGQLLERDIKNDRFKMQIQEDDKWMFKFIEPDQEYGLIYSFEEIEDLLDRLNVDYSQTEWYSSTTSSFGTQVHASEIPSTIDLPTESLSDIGGGYLGECALMPARVNGIQSCAVCNEDTHDDQGSYCLFGMDPIEFHEQCLYNFVATLQDILDGVEPKMVAKTI